MYQLTFDALGNNPVLTAGTATIGPKGELAFTAGTDLSNQISLLRDANIGIYQAGFYPTMMFGLPAVAIAMAVRAEDEHKKAV